MLKPILLVENKPKESESAPRALAKTNLTLKLPRVDRSQVWQQIETIKGGPLLPRVPVAMLTSPCEVKGRLLSDELGVNVDRVKPLGFKGVQGNSRPGRFLRLCSVNCPPAVRG